MRCFRVMLYEARDKVYCESYKDESGHEPIISTYIRARRLWIKWSHRDRSSGWEVLSFWLRNHEYEAKIVIYKTLYGQIAPSPTISIISIIQGNSFKGPWGIGRLSEVNNGIWPQIRMVFCRIKDIVIFEKKSCRAAAPLRQIFSHVFCSTDIYTYSVPYVRMYLWNRPFNGNHKGRRDESKCTRGEMPEMHTPFSFHHLLYQFLSFKASKTLLDKSSWV